MAFDFPTNPTNGQVYASGGITYVWTTYAWLLSTPTGPGTPGDYVLKAGDTMTGYLTLNADPTQLLHAATKQYVDINSGALPPIGLDGQAIVASGGVPVWGAAINGGIF